MTCSIAGGRKKENKPVKEYGKRHSVLTFFLPNFDCAHHINITTIVYMYQNDSIIRPPILTFWREGMLKATVQEPRDEETEQEEADEDVPMAYGTADVLHQY